MEVFSLEDEDYSGMFLTQSSHLDNISDNSMILPDPMDFGSPCVSLISKTQPHYSDISEDEFVDIPCSQVAENSSASKQR